MIKKAAIIFFILMVFIVSTFSLTIAQEGSEERVLRTNVQGLDRAVTVAAEEGREAIIAARTRILERNEFRNLTAEQNEKFKSLKEEGLEKLERLKEEKIKKFADLPTRSLKRFTELGEEKLNKVGELSVDELKKLSLLSRAKAKELVKLGKENLREELTKFKIKRVSKEERFKKRVITVTRVREAKARYEERNRMTLEVRRELRDKKSDFERAREQGNEELALEHAKAVLLKSADLVIKHLEKLKAKIEGMETLTEEEAAEAIAEINAKISEMEDAKANIEAATTREELKEAGSVIVNAWKRIKNNIRKHTAKIVQGEVREIIERSEHMEKRLEDTLIRMEEAGIEIADIDEMVDLFSSNVNEAREEKYKESRNLFNSAKGLRAEDPTANAQAAANLVQQSKAFAKEAHFALKEAHVILKDITKKIRLAGGELEEETEEVEEIIEEEEEEETEEEFEPEEEEEPENETESQV